MHESTKVPVPIVPPEEKAKLKPGPKKKVEQLEAGQVAVLGATKKKTPAPAGAHSAGITAGKSSSSSSIPQAAAIAGLMTKKTGKTPGPKFPNVYKGKVSLVMIAQLEAAALEGGPALKKKTEQIFADAPGEQKALIGVGGIEMSKQLPGPKDGKAIPPDVPVKVEKGYAIVTEPRIPPGLVPFAEGAFKGMEVKALEKGAAHSPEMVVTLGQSIWLGADEALGKAMTQAEKDQAAKVKDVVQLVVASLVTQRTGKLVKPGEWWSMAKPDPQELGAAAKKAGVSQLAGTIAKVAEVKDAPAPVKTPKLSFVPADPKGKKLITPANVKKLEAAAAQGMPALEEAGQGLLMKMASWSKKAAIANAVADLETQVTGLGSQAAAESDSEMATTVAQVAEGKQKLPKQSIPSAKTVHDAQREDKDWDKDLDQVSGKKGTNEGGLYKDKKMQTLHYVKWPGGAADIRARTEVLAARLYQLAGAPTPMVSLIDFGGKKAVKSDWIDGVEPMTTAKMRNHSDVTDHFVADAWLANWDVVGTSSDNIVKGPGNKAYRIDLGGSLLFRAQGKPKAFTGDVAELESMRNASQAPQASQVFGQMKLKDLKKSAKGVTGITDHQINQAVDAAGIPHTTSSDYPMKHGGTQSKDLNEWLKAVLKSRRDDIVKKVVKKKLPKEVSLAALKKASELDEKSLQLLLDKSGSLVAGGDSTTKRSVHDQICKNELGAQEGQEAAQTVRSHYSTWKGHTTTDQGNALRWASAEAFGKGKEARAALRAFWRYQAKGKTASQRKAHVAQRAQALDAHLASNGKALVEGVKANNAAHNALLRIQLVPKNKLKPGAKIVLYRGWKPDQVQAFGWSGAKPGDKITMSRPIVFSFSPNHSTANGFGHGGLVTKAEVPVRRVVLSDRLTYSKGSYVSEDEALWVAPGTKLEVMHAP